VQHIALGPHVAGVVIAAERLEAAELRGDSLEGLLTQLWDGGVGGGAGKAWVILPPHVCEREWPGGWLWRMELVLPHACEGCLPCKGCLPCEGGPHVQMRGGGKSAVVGEAQDKGHPAQHSTAQHSTAQQSTAEHSTVQHSTTQHSTVWHSAARVGNRNYAIPAPTLFLCMESVK
jgi:hypothetical protein